METEIKVGNAALRGDLESPSAPVGVVAFAHGSGSSRLSPRNRAVASSLHEAGLATLLMDLLTPDEEEFDLRSARLRFDIALLTERLVGAMEWLGAHAQTAALPLGLFGASTGAAAALAAAAERPEDVWAVVSRGGRPDLTGDRLGAVRAPTLLIVGGDDPVVIGMNREAMRTVRAEVRLEIVPGATHLFEEPGALERVAALAADWFVHHLASGAPGS